MIELSKQELAKYIDHTLLKADASTSELTTLCSEAKANGFASVCVNPAFIPLCKDLLGDSEVKIATVIGFPLGATLSNVKFYEAGMAILAGAQELDMVINITELKAGNLSYVSKEIADIVELARESNSTVKVIIETSMLTEEEKISACKVVTYSGAEYIKTSTGFGGGGATIEDIRLMRQHCGPKVKIKASGGVRTKEFALELIEAGADRIGTSAGVTIVQ